MTGQGTEYAVTKRVVDRISERSPADGTTAACCAPGLRHARLAAPPRSDYTNCVFVEGSNISANVGSWPILLQKSARGGSAQQSNRNEQIFESTLRIVG
jgi:hypothetical protein